MMLMSRHVNGYPDGVRASAADLPLYNSSTLITWQLDLIEEASLGSHYGMPSHQATIRPTKAHVDILVTALFSACHCCGLVPFVMEPQDDCWGAVLYEVS